MIRGPAASCQSRHWQQQKQPGDFFCALHAKCYRVHSGISRRHPSRKQHMATMSASTSGRESAPAAKRTKTATSEGASGVRRRFMPLWKNDFPWVTVCDGLMRCQYCAEAGKTNGVYYNRL